MGSAVSGALLTGVSEARWGGTDGLLFGHPAQFGIQAVGVIATIAYSAVGTFAVLKLVGLAIPLRATSRGEGVGMDITQHGEEAYTEGEGAVLVLHDDAESPVRHARGQPVLATGTGVA